MARRDSMRTMSSKRPRPHRAARRQSRGSTRGERPPRHRPRARSRSCSSSRCTGSSSSTAGWRSSRAAGSSSTGCRRTTRSPSWRTAIAGSTSSGSRSSRLYGLWRARRHQARAPRPRAARDQRARRRGADRAHARRDGALGDLGRDSGPDRLLPGRVGDAAAVVRLPALRGDAVARARRRPAAVPPRLRDAAAPRAVDEPPRLGRCSARCSSRSPGSSAMVTAAAAERARTRAPARAVGCASSPRPYALHLPAYYEKILVGGDFKQFVTEWAPTTLTLARRAVYLLVLGGLWLLGRAGRSAPLLDQLAFVAHLGARVRGGAQHRLDRARGARRAAAARRPAARARPRSRRA